MYRYMRANFLSLEANREQKIDQLQQCLMTIVDCG